MSAMQRAKRITGETLQRLRERLARKNPLCALCLMKVPEVVRLGTQRDHIKPLHQGGSEEESNTQWICDECHLQKSKQERGQTYKPRRRIAVDGYPMTEDSLSIEAGSRQSGVA